MNEKEAAEFLDLPVEIVNSLAERGYLKHVARTKPMKTDGGEGLIKKSVPNPFAFQPKHEYSFDVDDLREFKAAQERKKEDERRFEEDLHHTRLDLFVIVVVASRIGKDGKEEVERVDATWTGFDGTLEEAANEARKFTAEDEGGLPLSEGWRNHTTIARELSILVNNEDGSVRPVE